MSHPNPGAALLLAHHCHPPSPLCEGAFFFRVKVHEVGKVLKGVASLSKLW